MWLGLGPLGFVLSRVRNPSATPEATAVTVYIIATMLPLEKRQMSTGRSTVAPAQLAPIPEKGRSWVGMGEATDGGGRS